jgi:putative membrane protein
VAKDERQWWLDGVEPDQRYSLANERTFLAWIRIALAFVAGAVAVVQLVPPFAVPVARQALAMLLACGRNSATPAPHAGSSPAHADFRVRCWAR